MQTTKKYLTVLIIILTLLIIPSRKIAEKKLLLPSFHYLTLPSHKRYLLNCFNVEIVDYLLNIHTFGNIFERSVNSPHLINKIHQAIYVKSPRSRNIGDPCTVTQNKFKYYHAYKNACMLVYPNNIWMIRSDSSLSYNYFANDCNTSKTFLFAQHVNPIVLTRIYSYLS